MYLEARNAYSVKYNATVYIDGGSELAIILYISLSVLLLVVAYIVFVAINRKINGITA